MIESGVELREIRTFLVLADELHFGRTAERLHLTPSRVSQTIRTLEARVGARLFERTSRSVRLTPAGEHLRDAAAEPYRQLHEAVTATRDAASAVSGTLRIGMYTESLGGPHLLTIARAFEAAHPAATVALTTIGLERDYLDVLRAGEVDMLATRLPISDPDIAVGPTLTDEDRVLLVATSDPLARRASVTLEDFADRAVSDAPAFPREMMDGLIPPVTPSGRPYRRHISRSIEDMLLSIAAGKQVHPTVPSFLDHHAHPAIASVPITDLPPSKTALVWLATNSTPNLAALTQIATSVLGQDDSTSRTATRSTPQGVSGG